MEPGGPELRHWPGETVFDEEAEAPYEPEQVPEGDQGGEEAVAADETTPEPPDGRPHLGSASDERERSELDNRFVDISHRPDSVDVESAVTDKNIDRDENIRKIGWGNYGERLKKRNKPRKKKD